MAQLTEIQFAQALRNTETYKGLENFQQSIVMRRPNVQRLFVYYQQACREGIWYIKQNPSVFGREVNLINEIINETR